MRGELQFETGGGYRNIYLLVIDQHEARAWSENIVVTQVNEAAFEGYLD